MVSIIVIFLSCNDGQPTGCTPRVSRNSVVIVSFASLLWLTRPASHPQAFLVKFACSGPFQRPGFNAAPLGSPVSPCRPPNLPAYPFFNVLYRRCKVRRLFHCLKPWGLSKGETGFLPSLPLSKSPGLRSVSHKNLTPLLSSPGQVRMFGFNGLP